MFLRLKFSQPIFRTIYFWEFVCLVGVITISIYLRFTSLKVHPGWYSDEGTWAIIARNIVNGNNGYLGIENANLLIAKLPLFSYLSALSVAILGQGILTIRMLTAGLGVINTILTYNVVRFSGLENRRSLSLLAAFLYATFTDAILFSRIGFSYNLLATLFLLNFWGVINYLSFIKVRWLILCVLSVSLSLTTEVMAVALLPVSIGCILYKKWKHIIWVIPLILIPSIIFLLSQFLISPSDLTFDMSYTWFRVGTYPIPESIILIFTNYYLFLSHNFWILPGLVGLFLIQPIRLRYIVLLFLIVPLLLLFKTVPLSELADNYLIPFWPFICIGLANFIRVSGSFLTNTISNIIDYFLRGSEGKAKQIKYVNQWAKPLSNILLIGFFICIPFIFNFAVQTLQANVGFPQTFKGALVEPEEAQQTALFINHHLTPNDLVIASPVVASEIYGNVADFQTALAYQRIATTHLPGNIPHDRYLYACDFKNARFVVVDPIWTHWAIDEMPDLAKIYQDIQAWPLAYKNGDITVYRNPLK